MLELLMIIFLALFTIFAFIKKGLIAGSLIALALLLQLAGIFLRPADDDSFPIQLVFKGLGLIVLIFALLKYFSNRKPHEPVTS